VHTALTLDKGLALLRRLVGPTSEAVDDAADPQ
jgi:hypothetical protein